ncbi:hypothetical protein GW750_01140 [bacterium]|nr:hypothetical protein [bacterium]
MKDIAIYNLQQDTLISTSQDSIDPQHQTMRSMWSEMIPVSYRTPIIQFAIQTDGYGETM